MLSTGLFHPGRQHSWQVAAALKSAGALRWYATSIYYDPRRFPYRLASALPGKLGRNVGSQLARRATDLVDANDVRHLPALEWSELLAARAGIRQAAAALNRAGNGIFQRSVARLLAKESVDRLWGFDTSCAWLFEHPLARNSVRILDQTAGYAGKVREILLRQREEYPEYFSQLDVPSASAVAEADREIAAASHILVGARQGVDCLLDRGIDPARVHLLPFGYHEQRFPRQFPERDGLGHLPVRFLFVGAVNARKGIHLLLRAFQRFSADQAHLTLVGPLGMAKELLRSRHGNVEYVAALPHDRIVTEYEKAHCFLFPTLIDGGGIVLYEAAAAGLGIIQSANCGDGVREGRLGANGRIVAENTVEAWQAALESVIANPAILRDWSAASWAMREERTWTAYRQRIVELLPKLV